MSLRDINPNLPRKTVLNSGLLGKQGPLSHVAKQTTIQSHEVTPQARVSTRRMARDLGSDSLEQPPGKRRKTDEVEDWGEDDSFSLTQAEMDRMDEMVAQSQQLPDQSSAPVFGGNNNVTTQGVQKSRSLSVVQKAASKSAVASKNVRNGQTKGCGECPGERTKLFLSCLFTKWWLVSLCCVVAPTKAVVFKA